jgi:RNA polymerase sigma-70 factor (ECF subfamily)
MPTAAAAKAKIKKQIYDSPQELELVHRAKKGEETAFTDLYNHHHNRLLVVVTKIVQDANVAEGLTQDAMLKVWLKLSGFDENSKFSTWITRIAINEALMWLRKQKRKKQELSFEALQEHQPNEFQQAMTQRDLELEGIADRQVLSLAIASIPDPYKKVLQMRYWDGDSLEEICKTLRIRRGKVSKLKSRLLRGRKLLAKKVSKLSQAR